jgi:hypothetical protein
VQSLGPRDAAEAERAERRVVSLSLEHAPHTLQCTACLCPPARFPSCCAGHAALTPLCTPTAARWRCWPRVHVLCPPYPALTHFLCCSRSGPKWRGSKPVALPVSRAETETQQETGTGKQKHGSCKKQTFLCFLVSVFPITAPIAKAHLTLGFGGWTGLGSFNIAVSDDHRQWPGC